MAANFFDALFAGHVSCTCRKCNRDFLVLEINCHPDGKLVICPFCRHSARFWRHGWSFRKWLSAPGEMYAIRGEKYSDLVRSAYPATPPYPDFGALSRYRISDREYCRAFDSGDPGGYFDAIAERAPESDLSMARRYKFGIDKWNTEREEWLKFAEEWNRLNPDDPVSFDRLPTPQRMPSAILEKFSDKL